jgi:signal recognition particle receptor subunit beta
MVVLNYTGGEVNAKIVYYGPGLSGKTTNLEFIHDRTPEGARGKMVSMKTQTDRTLFFDFLPLELGEINGYRTRFLLYTVPGQVYYNATRKLVLKGVDAVVFVADSSRSKLDENLESLRNLEQNLNEHGMSLDELPWVIQYNKRDAADAMAVSDLDARLNPLRVPSYEAIATRGNGVYETFHGIATLVYRVLKERLERELEAVPATPGAPREQAAAQAPPVAAPGRAPAPTQPAAEEVEFESAIDSMLREMDPPSRAKPAPVAVPPPPPAPTTVNETMYKKAAAEEVPPATPAGVFVNDAPAPLPRAAAPAAPVAPAARAAQPAAAPRPMPEGGVFERAPESFDLELGRLPALEDAAAASDYAREEGPHEFVTDPMRRPAANKPARSPRGATATAPSPSPSPAPSPAPAPVAAGTLITVPVTLTREQARPGASIRLVLDIRIADE